ncbi:MAG TPA: MFS transporter [Candidatus Udaeobacter sp.]|jgi:MFS family permease|nr:MFS transporter [Candidatus Udaeobacter sp.]
MSEPGDVPDHAPPPARAASESPGAPDHPLPPGGFRTFVILWASQSVSVIGSALTFFAVNIWLTQVRFPRVEQKPELAFALSLTTLSFMLPSILVQPLAGAWADRHDRRRTMFIMNLAAGVVSTGLVLLLVRGRLELPILAAMLVVYGIFGAFHAAAFETSYAMLLPSSQLARATGMMQTTMALSNVLSPWFAAVLIGWPALARRGGALDLPGGVIGRLHEGTSLAVGIDAATFFVAAVALLGLHVPSPRRSDLESGAARKTLAHDIREGLLFVWHRRPMLWLSAMFAAGNFILGPVVVLQPLIVKFNLAADWRARHFTFETALALLATLNGVGGLVGAVVISAWGGLKRRRVVGVLMSLAAAGALIAAYGVSSSIIRSAVLIFFVGSTLPMANAHSQAIWLDITPRHMQGRVLAARRLVGQITFPLGTAIAGWLGARFDPGIATSVLGALMTVFALIQLGNPMLMRIEDRAWLERFAVSADRTRNAAGTTPRPGDPP